MTTTRHIKKNNMALHQYTYRFYKFGNHVLTKDFLAEDKDQSMQKAKQWFDRNKTNKGIDSFKLIYPVKYITNEE
jgi:hypothetical protein